MIRPLLAALLLTTPTLAQVIPTGSPAADILLSQAIAEHRVFLTCSVLDPAAHASIRQAWLADITAASRLLTDRKTAPEAVAAFTAAARADALVPSADTLFGDVEALCNQHPDWPTRYAAGDLIRLADSLPKALP